MGTCHEFGPSIQEGCDHPMQATRVDACTCGECGVVCHGRFPGCATVWARGPQEVHWKPQPAVGAALARRPEPGRASATVMADGGPGADEVAAALRRLVAEVGRLREDLDEQRARVADATVSIANEVRSAVAEELERLVQVDGTGSGVLRRLAGALQPASLDIDTLVRRVTSELVPAITAQVRADLASPVPEDPAAPASSRWQGRTA